MSLACAYVCAIDAVCGPMSGCIKTSYFVTQIVLYGNSGGCKLPHFLLVLSVSFAQLSISTSTETTEHATCVATRCIDAVHAMRPRIDVQFEWD